MIVFIVEFLIVSARLMMMTTAIALRWLLFTVVILMSASVAATHSHFSATRSHSHIPISVSVLWRWLVRWVILILIMVSQPFFNVRTTFAWLW